MISLVLVAHRSSNHLPAALQSFRAEAARLGRPAEVVVVEQSGDVDEEDRIREMAPDCLLVRPNRGYAAGLNAGIAAATGAVLLLANPDVRFLPNSLGALLDALDAGWDVAGPQFELAGWLFPPADVQTPAEELRRWLAGRWIRQRFLRREVRRWRRIWESAGPVAVETLSGALLAVRRETAARIGPWDEGYFLYFEETDWLRRARRLGLRAAVVPAARVEHAWGHAAEPGRYAGRFDQSRRRFYGRHFGPLGRAVSRLRVAGPPLMGPPSQASPGALWLLSPSPLGFPAAGLRSEMPPRDATDAFLAACPHCTALTLFAYDPLADRIVGKWTLKSAATSRW